MNRIGIAQCRESISRSQRIQEFARAREKRPRPTAELHEKRRGWHDQIPLGDKCFRKRQRFEGSNLELAKKRTRHETVPDGRGIRGRPEHSPQAIDSGEINEYATKVEEQYVWRCHVGSHLTVHCRGSTDPRSPYDHAHARRRSSATYDVQLCIRRGAGAARSPARPVRAFVDEIVREMTREFDALYAQQGRPSIPPERLLRAQLLQLFSRFGVSGC
jgi:hypothetical protein